MAERGTGTCSHGMTVSTCLICKTLEPDRRGSPEADRAPVAGERRAPSAGGMLVRLAVVGVVLVLVASWLIALAWTVLRVVQLVAVALGAGWVGWRQGVRYGRRHPG